jgi:CheY-like chemotaxis protein
VELTSNDQGKIIDILLVEDSPSDARLTIEAFKEAKVRNRVYVATDGVTALEIIRGRKAADGLPCPDLILLDLNLPMLDGRHVLAEIKADPLLRKIPVVILTSSGAEQDLLNAYGLHANAYIQKPPSFDGLFEVVQAIQGFWLGIVKVPGEPLT